MFPRRYQRLRISFYAAILVGGIYVVAMSLVVIPGSSKSGQTVKASLWDHRIFISKKQPAYDADGGFHTNETRTRMNYNMFNKVRVLCWVMTSPATFYKKAIHINETWGPRCDVTLYMSSQSNSSFPNVVALNVTEGRKSLWNKTKAAFTYIYKHHFHDADWFMKADDDTYVIVDNLRYFLAGKNSSEAIYYGHNFRKFTRQGYMSGGAGYVLSKEAIRRFAVEGSRRRGNCSVIDHSLEDIGIGKCMSEIGVVAGDSRDALNRTRFIPFSIGAFSNEKRGLPSWYAEYKKYDIQQGSECCSEYLISCHYISPGMMHVLDFAVYHLKSASREAFTNGTLRNG